MAASITVCGDWLLCVRWAHYDVIKGKYFPRYWLFVRMIHRSPMNSPHIGQWRGALTFPLICAWINGWVNNGEAGDLRRHRAHYGVVVMCCWTLLLLDKHILYQMFIENCFCTYTPHMDASVLAYSMTIPDWTPYHRYPLYQVYIHHWDDL